MQKELQSGAKPLDMEIMQKKYLRWRHSNEPRDRSILSFDEDFYLFFFFFLNFLKSLTQPGFEDFSVQTNPAACRSGQEYLMPDQMILNRMEPLNQEIQ